MEKTQFNFIGFGLLLAAQLAAGQAHAALSFTGDFAPENWSLRPGSGTVAFNSTATELQLKGPSGKPATSSLDLAWYLGAGGTGAPDAGTLTFNWHFNSEDATSASAEIGSGTSFYTLASGGPGTTSGGTYSITLAPGGHFAFLLSTEAPTGKPNTGELLVSNLSFTAVPEASTLWFGAGALGLMAFTEVARRSKSKAPVPALALRPSKP